MFKKQKIDFTPEIEAATKLYNQLLDNQKHTLPLSNVEGFLEEWRTLLKVIEDKGKTAPEKTKSKAEYKVPLNKLEGLMNSVKGQIIYQFKRNLSYKDNYSIKAEELLELPATIKKVEDEFLEKMKQAEDYLKLAIDGEFHFGIGVSELFMPHSIEEIRQETLKGFNWNSYTILDGYPQPYYKDRYNAILEKAIEKYIDG